MTSPLPPSSMGTGVFYDYSASSAAARPLHSLRAAPITHFSSVPNDGIGNEKIKLSHNHSNGNSSHGLPTAGHLLAVDPTYIAYAVKKGLVRVIHRQTNAKTLLRGHAEHTSVVDAAFFGDHEDSVGVGSVRKELAVVHHIKNHSPRNAIEPPVSPLQKSPQSSNLLATVGGMGDTAGVIIWFIGNMSQGTDNNNHHLGYQKLASLPTNCAARVVWSPFRPEFVLLHRNYATEDDPSMGSMARQVATLVTPTFLSRAIQGDNALHGTTNMHSLSVKFDNEGSRSSSGLEGANDIAWSGTGRNCVLTGHDDGCVRLWDVSSQEEAKDERTIDSIHSIAKMNVVLGKDKDDEGGTSVARAVTRVLFLNRYEDSFNDQTSTSTTRAITSPFITGTDMNHTVTLWSAFTCESNSSIIGYPTRLRVFGLRNYVSDDSVPLSDMISLEICPAPYRPPLSLKDSSTPVTKEEIAAPSSFLLMAERNAGLLHALHVETDWKASSAAVAVKGFDYVTTLNVVHPIYSFCVAPTASTFSSDSDGGGRKNALKEDHDVDLCCIQSKAVQMLTLAAEMCAAPENNSADDLAPGVTLLKYEDEGAGVALDEDEADEEDYEEDDFEDDYELGEDAFANAEFSTNHSDGDEEDIVAAPLEEVQPEDPASNWLGAIVNPLASSTPARTSSSPPGLTRPPGLGIPSASMPFLSPMQILSESSSDIQESNHNLVKSPSQVTALASPTSKPVAKLNKQKDQVGKKKAESKQPLTTPMKILQRGELKDELVVESILPVSVSTVSATTVPDVTVSNIDLGEIDAIVQRSVAAQLKSHETELLSSFKKVITSEVRSVISSSFKDAEKATEQAIHRGIATGLSSGLKKSLEGELGKSLKTHSKESVVLATKETLKSMKPLIINSFHEVSVVRFAHSTSPLTVIVCLLVLITIARSCLFSHL
jgi:hypothetical protein